MRDRLEAVWGRMERAAKTSGRSLKDVTLVAVTKGVAADAIAQAHDAGVLVFGENKIQEALGKIPQVSFSAEWHLVGHLQTNKVKEAVGLFSVIQSVDSVRLAEKINRECAAAGKTVSVFLEVKLSGEARKYGFGPEDLYAAIESMREFSAIRISGLMGIAPYEGAGPPEKREAFKKLRNLFSVCKSLKQENLAMRFLSMGMSDDFEIAIEEGSNLIRLGRAIFGERMP